jgi:hypothetical protein
MSNWVSAAELERREAASRKAEAKAAREAEQQRTQNQAREREDAALDARYGALPAEAKAALDAVVLADLGGAISFLKRRPPETVMQGYRREKLRAGWRHDPAAPPPRREYSDLETPGRGTSAPRPDPREKSDWQLVPDTTPEQALARQRELAIARGASPDILAALGVLP